jgi:hypothetical protein
VNQATRGRLDPPGRRNFRFCVSAAIRRGRATDPNAMLELTAPVPSDVTLGLARVDEFTPRGSAMRGFPGTSSFHNTSQENAAFTWSGLITNARTNPVSVLIASYHDETIVEPG